MPPQYRYEQIAADLAARIDSGEFPAGSKLPSRRELVEHYEVTEPVIDRAMLVLRLQGRTETLQGVGVFVRADVRAADAVCDYWRRRYEETNDTPADYLIAAASRT